MGDEAEFKAEYPDGTTLNWLPRSGAAKVTYADGSNFEGNFDSERLKSGKGKYNWVKSTDDDEKVVRATYEGQYRAGKRHGIGKMTFPNGDTYHGQWEENKIHGEGTYVYKSSNDVYSGSWENNLKHGQGTYLFGADESQIVGRWNRGSIDQGEWRFRDGGVFVGGFVQGKPRGQGVYRFPSGIVQEGEFVQIVEEGDEENARTVWRGRSVITV